MTGPASLEAEKQSCFPQFYLASQQPCVQGQGLCCWTPGASLPDMELFHLEVPWAVVRSYPSDTQGREDMHGEDTPPLQLASLKNSKLDQPLPPGRQVGLAQVSQEPLASLHDGDGLGMNTLSANLATGVPLRPP